MYYSPVKPGDTAKYPLVIYFHGMGQGSEPGAQIKENNIALWAGEDLQSRFTNGGAFLFVPRSHEEEKKYWPVESIGSVKAAIDDFIAKNSEYIDTARIYVGGFSMGGKMTLMMATSYPDSKKTSSNHHVWFAASNDMFMYDGSEYVNAVTADASGKEVKLTEPDGLISWLCSFTSDYGGEELESTGLCGKNTEKSGSSVSLMFRALFLMLADALKSLSK